LYYVAKVAVVSVFVSVLIYTENSNQ